MEVYMDVEVKLHIFWIFALTADKWLASHSRCMTSRTASMGQVAESHCMWWQRKISLPVRK
jgi:hypothetical protein